MAADNDFALKLANVNGTGSASANGLLMQAIFRMGVPVSGKNLFPSNIQGLPTWYEIRVQKDGHVARTQTVDLFVAMNAETYAADVAEVRSGGYLIFDSTWPLDPSLDRKDIHFLGVPLARLCGEAFADSRERILMKNIAYVGVLMELLEIDKDVVDKLLEEKFAGKPKLRTSNHKALEIGRRYAVEHLPHPLPFKLAPMNATGSSILIDGNTAAALGCVYAGATVAAWYPITPATSLMDAFRGFVSDLRKNPDGTMKACIVQAEDELAAIGMTIGGAWAGARAFTSTAGPGISLMGELIGLAYYAEVPVVVVDVQRVGPSTGMPTRTQQGDILACAYASHGDTKHILVFPANPEECFYMVRDAFDLAERFQTPVFMLSDLDIGMNDWVCKRLEWDDSYRPDRGRVLGKEEVESLKTFTRYWPVDENFVPARTLPGVSEKGAYFTRGSGHNKLGAYTESPREYQEVVDRLAQKHRAAAKAVPKAIIDSQSSTPARFGVITVGGCDGAVREALSLLRARGLELDFMRVRGFPFGAEVEAFILAHERCYVVEQNRDAQLRTLFVAELGIDPARLIPALSYGGFPLSASEVIEHIAPGRSNQAEKVA